VTATDNAGNTSAATAGKTYTLTRFQENSSSISYSSGWTRQALSGASGGYVKYATVAGNTATFTFTGIQVAWVSTQGPKYGSAGVKLDSGPGQTINTNYSVNRFAHVVDVISTSLASHKLVVKVLGTSGHPRIDIDDFVVLSD
jgi:hypothetical protein